VKTVTVEITDLEYEILAELAKAVDSRPNLIAAAAVKDRLREWDHPIVKRVAFRHAQGMSTAQIATALGVTNRTVSSAYRVLGVRANPGRGRSTKGAR
jgi:hypothetical protein